MRFVCIFVLTDVSGGSILIVFFPPVWCDALWIVLSAGQVQNTYHFFFFDSTSRTKWTGSRFAVVMKKLKWMVCWSRLRSWKIKFHWFWTWGPPCRNFFISNLTYLMLPTLVLQSVCRCWNVVAVVKQWQLSMALPMRIGLNFVGIENGTEKYHRRLFLGCALKFQFPSGNQILEPIAKCTTLVFKFEQHKNARHNSLLILLIILFFDDFCIASRWFQKTVLVTILGFQPREGMTGPMPCQLQLLFWFSILVSHVGNCSSDTFFWFAVQPYNAVGEMIFCHSHHRHRCSSFAGKFAIEQFRFSECPRILSQNVCVATEFKLRWWHWFFTIHYTHLNFPRNYILLISNDQFVPRDFSLSRGMRCKNSCCRDACVASNCLSFCIAATGAFQCLANLINAFSNRFSNSCVDMWYPSTIVADVQFTLRTAYRLGKNYIQFF